MSEDKQQQAREYLDLIRTRLQDSPQKYDDFVKILQKFKNKELSVSDVTKRVAEILDGHNDLIKKFEIFLPEEKHIEKQAGAAQLPAIAYQFVNTVRNRFANTNPDVYSNFLTILKQFKDNRISISDVTLQIATLFEGHDDLQSQFKLFLPLSAPAVPQPTSYETRNKTTLLQSAGNSGNSMNDRHYHSNDNRDFERKRNIRQQQQQQQQQHHQIMQQQQQQQQQLQKMEMARKRKMRHENNNNNNYNTINNEISNLPKRKRTFFENIRSFLVNDSDWKEFVKCLFLYSEQIITIEELFGLVNDILFDTPYLFKEFVILVNEYKNNIITTNIPNNTQNTQNTANTLNTANTSNTLNTSIPQVLDIESLSNATPSYKIIPTDRLKDFSTPTQSRFINSQYISYSSKILSNIPVTSNPYNDILCRYDDKMVEYDINIDIFKKLIELLERHQRNINLLYKVMPLSIYNYKIPVTDFTVLYIKTINSLYPNSGKTVINSLIKNPFDSIEIILDRCKSTYKNLEEKRDSLKKTMKMLHEKYIEHSYNNKYNNILFKEKKELNNENIKNEINNIPFTIIDTNKNEFIIDEENKRNILKLEFNNNNNRNDLHRIIYNNLISLLPSISTDKSLITNFYHYYLCPLLDIPSPVDSVFVTGTIINHPRFKKGKIIKYRDSDEMVEIKYDYCIGYSKAKDIEKYVEKNNDHNNKLFTCINYEIYQFLRYYNVLYNKYNTIEEFSKSDEQFKEYCEILDKYILANNNNNNSDSEYITKCSELYKEDHIYCMNMLEVIRITLNSLYVIVGCKSNNSSRFINLLSDTVCCFSPISLNSYISLSQLLSLNNECYAVEVDYNNEEKEKKKKKEMRIFHVHTIPFVQTEVEKLPVNDLKKYLKLINK